MAKHALPSLRYRVRIAANSELAEYLGAQSDPGFSLCELATMGLAARNLGAEPRLAWATPGPTDKRTAAPPAARPAPAPVSPVASLPLDAFAELGAAGRNAPGAGAGTGS